MKITIHFLHSLIVVTLILFSITSCSHFPDGNEWTPESEELNSFAQGQEGLSQISKTNRANGFDLLDGLTFDNGNVYSFNSNGLRVTLYQIGNEMNSGVIRVENTGNLILGNAPLSTLKIRFNRDIGEFAKVFQVASNIGPIRRSVEFEGSTLLTEFFPSLEPNADPSSNFSFALYFDLHQGAAPWDIASFIEEIGIYSSGIESAIWDDYFILSELELGSNGKEQRHVHHGIGNEDTKWARMVEMIEWYLAGAQNGIIKKTEHEWRLKAKNKIGFTYVFIEDRIGIELTIFDDTMSMEEILY